ncbi:uncharacterized protein G2W53_034072 [Senna tora]|uniref:Uncharacterized protein n=1 Tax=Senna tora TaxID=362788 RepID=A0A834WBJ8_9FABA|nr:uncharacterized protein G2W53_034072 [Senna tora]
MNIEGIESSVKTNTDLRMLMLRKRYCFEWVRKNVSASNGFAKSNDFEASTVRLLSNCFFLECDGKASSGCKGKGVAFSDCGLRQKIM